MEQNKSTLVLTPDQTKALDDLRDRIKDELETEVEKNWCSDRTMCRYLRARDWDVDKAHKMLSNSIKWRKEYNSTHQKNNPLKGTNPTSLNPKMFYLNSTMKESYTCLVKTNKEGECRQFHKSS